MFRPREEPEEQEGLESLGPPSHPRLTARVGHRYRRLRKVLRGLVATMALLIVAYAGLNIYASIRLSRALEHARAQGEPLTMPELAPPPVPDSQNAALLYEQADKAASYSQNEELLLLKLGLPGTSPSENTAAAAILARSQKAIELARRASVLPACRFPIDWSQQPTKILFPQYARMRRLARLAGVQAMVEARRGDTASALRDVRVMFAMSAHLKDEPVLIGFLVARALDAIANRALARVIEAAPITMAQARQFEDSLPAVDWSASFRRAMLGERAFGLSTFEMVRSDPSLLRGDLVASSEEADEPRTTGLLVRSLGALWAPMLKLDEVEILHLWEMHLQAVTPMIVPMPPAKTAAIDRALQGAPPYALVTKMLFPVFSRAYQHRDSIEVGRRQRQVALALSAYRKAHGHYPGQLSQAEPLRGAIPQDVYAPQPLRYTSDERTFSLYSIGPNRVDDGGRDSSGRDLNGQSHPAPPPTPATDDIVWNPKSR